MFTSSFIEIETDNNAIIRNLKSVDPESSTYTVGGGHHKPVLIEVRVHMVPYDADDQQQKVAQSQPQLVTANSHP